MSFYNLVKMIVQPAAKVPPEYGHMAVRRTDTVSKPRTGRAWATYLCLLNRGPVAACVGLKTTVCAAQQLRLYKRANKGGKTLKYSTKAFFDGKGLTDPSLKAAQFMASGDVVEITDHPFLTVWNDANPFQTGNQFRRDLFKYLNLAGDFGAMMYGASEPTMLLPLCPQGLEVVPDPNGFIKEYRWGVDEVHRKVIAAEDVCFFAPTMGTFDPFRGESWLSHIVKETGLFESTIEGMTALMKNGMNPSAHFALSEGQGADDVTRATEYLKAQYGGVNNWGRMLVTTSAKVVPLTMTPKDTQSIEQLNAMATEIYAAACVPEAFRKLNDANLAGAAQGDRFFGRYAVQPDLNSVSDTVTERILPRFGLGPEYLAAYDSVVPEDDAARMQKAQAFFAMGMPANEALARIGEPPFDGGDVARSQAPMGLGLPTGAAPEAPEDDTEEPKDTTVKALHKHKPGCGCAVTKSFGDDPLEPLMESMRRDLSAWYVRTLQTAPLTEAGLEITAAQLAEFEAITNQWLGIIYRGGGAFALQSVGADDAFTTVGPKLTLAVEERVRLLVTTVPQTLKDQVASVIREGLEQDQTFTQIATNIRTEAPALTGWQAERIARTEGITGYNESQHIAYTEAGVPYKTWEVAGGPCPLCEGLGFKYGTTPIPMGDAFEYEGFVSEYPPAHPNCRCVMVPTYISEGKAIRATAKNRKSWKGAV